MAVSAPPSANHVAPFYRTGDFLASRVAAFISEGLTAGEQVIVLATGAHWAETATRLAHGGLAFRRAVDDGQLLLLDADEVLDGQDVRHQHTHLVTDSGDRVNLQ